MSSKGLLNKVTSQPRTRLLLVGAWVLLSIAWLVASDLILDTAQSAGVLSPFETVVYLLWRRAIFLAATGTLIYLLLGRQRRDNGNHHDQLRALVESSPAGTALTGPNGVLTYANPAFFRLFDVTPAIIGLTNIEDLLRGRVEGSIPSGMLPVAGKSEFTVRTQTPDGREQEMLCTITARLGSTDGYTVAVTDATESRRISRRFKLFTETLDGLSVGIAIGDATRSNLPLVYVNREFEALTGYTADECLGNSCSFLQGGDRQQSGVVAVRKAIAQQRPITVNLRNYHKSGSMFWNELSLTPLFDNSGRITHYVGMQRNVSDAREVTETLERAVYNDNITSLLNRQGFMKGLSELLMDPDNESVLVVKADIHNFHEFNTALGWDVGDALLIAVAERLSRMLPDHCIGRIGSNEFGVALPIRQGEAEATVTSVRRVLEGRYVLPGTTCEPLFAIGYTVGARHLRSRQVMQQASVALNEARASVFGETRRFDRETETTISERRRLTSELQEAVQNGDFIMQYQPKVDLPDGRIIGAEALVRWRHPLFGLQPPARFVGLAEETGLIVDIGDQALNQAVAFAAALNTGRAVPMPIGVNVSFAQFRRLDLVKSVETALNRHNAHPTWLQLELTESIYIAASPETLSVLERLRDLGVGLVIDDFGTGYSSLRYLADFPVNEIKIDRCFVTGLKEASVNRAVVEAILSMGAAKRAVVTAEGIETEEERRLLRDLGCHVGQGFLFSSPIPPEELRWIIDNDLRLPLVSAASAHQTIGIAAS